MTASPARRKEQSMDSRDDEELTPFGEYDCGRDYLYEQAISALEAQNKKEDKKNNGEQSFPESKNA